MVAQPVMPYVTPTTQGDGSDETPGNVAAHILHVAHNFATEGKECETELIRTLRCLPPVREPIIRRKASWPLGRRLKHLRERAVNVESRLMQIVGRIPINECMCCQNGFGPWTKCVVYEISGMASSSCANCLWGRHFRHCSFNSSPQIFSAAQESLLQEEGDAPFREASRLKNTEWAAGLALLADRLEKAREAINTVNSELASCFSMVQEEFNYFPTEMDAVPTLFVPPPNLNVALTELAGCAAILDDLQAKMSPSELE